MARYSAILVTALLICVATLGAADKTREKPVTIPVPTTSTPAPETPTAPTTEPPTTKTTEPQTTKTTELPTTTTTTITTTSPPPPPPPKPTPPKPTPPPTPAPTPAPAPGPLPPPQRGTWSYLEKNVTCIIVQFAARLNVTYLMNEGNNSTKLANALLNIPANATVVGGSCGNETQWIQISWPNASWANNVTLQFGRNDSTHLYSLLYFNATLTPDNHFPNSSSYAPLQLSHASPEWAAPLAASYRCLAPTQLNMTETEGAVATLSLDKLQEQAFRTLPGPGFSAARDCGGGDVPDAVPIAVGCALGGLVLLVLAAYLLGRRRAAARGYLSM